HEAPPLPGAPVVVNAELTKIQGRTLTFSVEAHDGLDTISRGTHERVVIFRERFIEKLNMRKIKADNHNQ
ncbi:MAG: thioesterase, partial [Betaproteobacteria bacterium]|nr:thioesterase [Betaproteobacteria bacterium]